MNEWESVFFWTGAIGFISSYAIEFLQVYIPGRNSAWDDVITNSIGSLVGFLLYATLGSALLTQLSQLETTIEHWLTIPRATLIVAIYFGMWLALSAHFQKETRLTNWDPSAWLFLGNDAKGVRPWNGKIQRIDIWNEALSEAEIQQSNVGQSRDSVSQSPIVNYDLSGLPPYISGDQRVPALTAHEKWSKKNAAGQFDTSNHGSLSTNEPITWVLGELKRTNQFTIRMLCIPNQNIGDEGEILSISSPGGVTDFALRQDGSNLVMALRNGLTSRRSRLDWEVRDVFKSQEMQIIVISYDGSWAALNVNDRRISSAYRLGPGTSIVRRFIRAKTDELDGYFLLLDIMIFMPLGLLLGISARRGNLEEFWLPVWIAAIYLIPPIILEWILVWVSGRAASLVLIVMSVILTFAGYLFVDADSECPDSYAS